MGRHSAPTPERAGPLVGRSTAVLTGSAIVVVVAIVIASITVLGGDGIDQTRPEADASVISPTITTAPPSGAEATSATAAPSPMTSASPSFTPSPTVSRPATLALVLTGQSYITVRGPEGHTLDSGLFRRGDRLSYDQPLLRVVIGNAAAVRATVNGEARKPGRPGQVQRFTVRRR